MPSWQQNQPDDRPRIRAELNRREPLSDDAFLCAVGLPPSFAATTIVRSVRERLAELADLPSMLIYPDDEFNGDLASLLEWPELDVSIDVSTIARELGIRPQIEQLERITDPSSPRRKGAVSDLVCELHRALV